MFDTETNGFPSDGVDIPQKVLEKVPITKQLLREKNAKQMSDVGPAIVKFLSKFQSVILVAHNCTRFDEKVMREEFKRNKLAIPTTWQFLDSMDLAVADVRALDKVIRASSQKKFNSSEAKKHVIDWFRKKRGIDQRKITEFLKKTITPDSSTTRSTKPDSALTTPDSRPNLICNSSTSNRKSAQDLTSCCDGNGKVWY